MLTDLDVMQCTHLGFSFTEEMQAAEFALTINPGKLKCYHNLLYQQKMSQMSLTYSCAIIT